MSCDTLGPMTSDFYLRSFQIATAAILGYLLLRVLDPLSGMLGWAAVLAFILHPLLKSAASMGGSVALGAIGTLVGFFMMLFMLFFFLRDGRAMLDGLTRLVPVEHERRARLLKYLADVTRAVVFGSTVTALIQ